MASNSYPSPSNGNTSETDLSIISTEYEQQTDVTGHLHNARNSNT